MHNIGFFFAVIRYAEILQRIWPRTDTDFGGFSTIQTCCQKQLRLQLQCEILSTLMNEGLSILP